VYAIGGDLGTAARNANGLRAAVPRSRATTLTKGPRHCKLGSIKTKTTSAVNPKPTAHCDRRTRNLDPSTLGVDDLAQRGIRVNDTSPAVQTWMRCFKWKYPWFRLFSLWVKRIAPCEVLKLKTGICILIRMTKVATRMNGG